MSVGVLRPLATCSRSEAPGSKETSGKVKVVPDSSIDVMRGAEVLVINGLRERPHPVHLSIPEALEIVAEVRPERAYLTHLSHDVGHAEWSARLPSGVELAYDGLTVELDDGR